MLITRQTKGLYTITTGDGTISVLTEDLKNLKRMLTSAKSLKPGEAMNDYGDIKQGRK